MHKGCEATLFPLICTSIAVLLASTIAGSVWAEDGQSAAKPADATAAASTAETEEATQQRVRELVYILREHRVFERCDQWGAAIRELSEIGPPALPELLLELKSTNRGTTMRGVLFAVRVIDDSRALPYVIAELPKAERLSRSGSDCGIGVRDEELYRFLKQHENYPHKDSSITYGRPINEIISTLYCLANKPYPDLKTKNNKVETTWRASYWQQWWDDPQNRPAQTDAPPLVLPERADDLVSRDGARRYGMLFPTGPGNSLSRIAEVELLSSNSADVLCCLDIETGRLYEYLEGVEREKQKTTWEVDRGIDFHINNGCDLHVWQIANERWDTLEVDVQSDKPFDRGREATSDMIFNLKPGKIATYLFTTREGSDGIVRLERIAESHRYACKVAYRLWNQDVIEPHAARAAESDDDSWEPTKLVVLKEPGIETKCFYSFEDGKSSSVPAALFGDEAPPDVATLLDKNGQGLFADEKIAAWAREHEIDLASSRIRIEREFAPIDPAQKEQPRAPAPKHVHEGRIARLLLRDARSSQVSVVAFERMSVDHAREILARNPQQFRTTALTPPDDADCSSVAFLFENRSGRLGVVQILSVGENLSSINFRYKLAKKNTSGDAEAK